MDENLNLISYWKIFKLTNQINHKNILTYKKSSIKKITKKLTSNEYNKLMRKILNRFIKKNYKLDINFISKVKKIISLTNVELSNKEIIKLRLIEEWIFTKNRKLKKLDTNIPLDKNEFLYAQFDNAHLFVKSGFLTYEIISANLLLTNKAIILWESVNKNFKFSYSKIDKKSTFHDYGYVFIFQNKKYILTIHSQVTLKLTLQKLMNNN